MESSTTWTEFSQSQLRVFTLLSIATIISSLVPFWDRGAQVCKFSLNGYTNLGPFVLHRIRSVTQIKEGGLPGSSLWANSSRIFLQCRLQPSPAVRHSDAGIHVEVELEVVLTSLKLSCQLAEMTIAGVSNLNLGDGYSLRTWRFSYVSKSSEHCLFESVMPPIRPFRRRSIVIPSFTRSFATLSRMFHHQHGEYCKR